MFAKISKRLAPAMLALTLMGGFSSVASAQGIIDVATPARMPGEIDLPVTSPALAKEPETWANFGGNNLIVHNVSQPTLTPFLPAAGTETGTAVIIAPGGGFMMGSMDTEGYQFARYLASKGVAAFVLKYRLLPTPKDGAGMAAALIAAVTGGDPNYFKVGFKNGVDIATEDAVAAMKVVRDHAKEWKIDPAKVGFSGFSAGAFTTLNLALTAGPETMPNFIAPIYGGMGTPDKAVPASPPPMWVSFSSDDALFGKGDFGLVSAWRSAGGSVELHMYEKGGHGYGFPGTPGATNVHWPDQFFAWLVSRGLAPAK